MLDSYVEVSLIFQMEGLGPKHVFLSVQIIFKQTTHEFQRPKRERKIEGWAKKKENNKTIQMQENTKQ